MTEKSPTRPGWIIALRFDADVVVHRSANPLLAAEISFGCLHEYMAKQELNLVKFAAGGMAQLRA